MIAFAHQTNEPAPWSLPVSQELNPPLRVGQILDPRPTSDLPRSKIVDYRSLPSRMLWVIEPSGGGEPIELTLSEIYAEFKFAS